MQLDGFSQKTPAAGAGDIFIVGAPRSGTTWLQRLIATHPAVASPQETFFFSHYALPLLQQYEKSCRHLDSLHADLEATGKTNGRVNGLGALLTRQDVVSWLQFGWTLLRDRALELKPGSWVVAEKSPSHGANIDLIREVSPGCRVVHIIRDPRQVARSVQRAPWNSGSRADLVAGARSWQGLVRKARVSGGELSDYLEVDYEDLKKESTSALLDVLEFLGLEATAATAERLVATASDMSRQDSSELVLGGHAAELRLPPVEPSGFDVRSRGSHAALSTYEEWLVFKNAPLAVELGYTAAAQTRLLKRAGFEARYLPLRFSLRRTGRIGRMRNGKR